MEPETEYLDSLRGWCRSQESTDVEAATKLGHEFHARGLSPDQIVALHAATTERVVKPNDASGLVEAQHFLLVVMIGYGDAHQAQSKSAAVESEAAVAPEHQRALNAEEQARQHLDLLANISHELGTPLTVVQGNLAVLRRFERPSDLLPAEIAVREADIDAAVERMRSLGDQLLTASQQQEPLELIPLLVDHVVERATRWAALAIGQKGLDVVLRLECREALIAADEQALHSIFGNLLSNAVRYTPTGGTVSVATSCTSAMVTVEVSDTGIGMSDEEKARAFERFYRSPHARQMSSLGLRLGLPLTMGLVEAMNGTITIDSSPGNGSTFSVVFPRLATDGIPGL